MNIRIEIDPKSGFCFGVVYAVRMAEEFLEEYSTLYCLGDIVHNDEEVKRLSKKGLKIIRREDLNHLQDVPVLIRAHGEPPETYELALKNRIRLIDASCPVVLKLQNRIRLAAERSDAQIVIYGKEGHPEVIGLMGQTKNQAILITSEEDLDKIDFHKPIILFSQTTKSTLKFYKIVEKIKQKAQNEVIVNDTICRQVSNREPQLRQFANQYDIILFVAGKKSSNGRALYEVCRSVNPRSYFISSCDEIDLSWFQGVQSIGICGATSTPQWLMEKVKHYLETHLSQTYIPS